MIDDREAKAIALANGFTCPTLIEANYIPALGWYLSNGCIGINVAACKNEEELRGTILHELGHRWHATHPKKRMITGKFIGLWATSDYGTKNTNEKIAEAFRMYFEGTLPAEHTDALEEFGLCRPM